jgi:Sensors of blue-light using FAD
MSHPANQEPIAPENASACLYQMAYCSILKQELDAASVQEIVAQAQRNNLASNITGMLMIEQGLVIQWLEGSKADVRTLWAKLQRDPRHHCIVELLHRHVAQERLFPDWSMQRTNRQEMLEIIHSAREQAQRGEPSPWAGAIATMCILMDPDYAKSYGAALQNQAAAASPLASGSAA